MRIGQSVGNQRASQISESDGGEGNTCQGENILILGFKRTSMPTGMRNPEASKNRIQTTTRMTTGRSGSFV